MTVEEFFVATYQTLEGHKAAIGSGLVAVPVVGTVAAWIGKGGKTDQDGIFIANVVITMAVGIFAFAFIAGLIGLAVMKKSLLDADLVLLLSPVICAVGTFFGIRKLFPLGELSSIQTLKDVGLFLLACVAVWFIFKSFRGWGIIFFGTITQLIVWGLAGVWLMRRLARRAFGSGSDETAASDVLQGGG